MPLVRFVTQHVTEQEWARITGSKPRRHGPKTYYQRNPVCHGCGYKGLGVFRLQERSWVLWECWDCWTKIRADGEGV